MSSDLAPRDRRRIEDQLRLAALARSLLPAADAPYFAHLRVETVGRETDGLLGPVTRISPDLSIIDWKAAPLAEVFFAYDEGEEYEITVDRRLVSGKVLERNLVHFDRGELVGITTSGGFFSRQAAAGWRKVALPRAVRLKPRAASDRCRPSSPVDVKLDAAQRRVVELAAQRSVLILGEAGFGKTTVALHRLAYLRKAAGKGFRGAVIVPSEGLRRLSELALERLGVRDVEVMLYDRWAAMQARRAFRGLPRRESQDARAGVIRLKRHAALRGVLADFVQHGPRPSADDQNAPATRAGTRYCDLEYLFGDRPLMLRVVAASDQVVNAGMVAEVVEHTRVQFSETTEEEYAHVDAERLKTLDGRAIDYGTPMADAKTIDVEDYAVLFELDRLRAEPKGKRAVTPRAYDCIVVDEAQELAPIELSLIGRSVSPRGTLVVAGDAAQQVDPTAGFSGWTQTMADLGCRTYETSTLEVSYRCPPEVTALARSVLDPRDVRAHADHTAASPLAFARFENECHLAVWLMDELRSLVGGDPRASVAIICRTPEEATRFARALRRGVGVRLALDGDFAPHGGINVTCVQEAKGLEFDHVVVPDAAPRGYPDLPESRRALYVAVTRAIHQLVLVTAGQWTPILGASGPGRGARDARRASATDARP